MARKPENGQALIELLLGLLLILGFFFFAFFASETSIQDQKQFRFDQRAGAWR